MTPSYPDGLPLGLHSGRTYQLESPLQRTQLSSGRARQRRRFTSVPEYVDISWYFSGLEATTFSVWFRDALVDGALWFTMPLGTIIGLDEYECRFTEVFNGPSRAGPDLWSVSARLEIRNRVVSTYPPGWGEFPEFILEAGIIDRALNDEWPLNKFQVHIADVDRAINQEWPEA